MQQLLNRITPIEILRMIGVFVVILLAAKLGQYFFFEWHTSPAILWPPTGIALAIMWLWGYRYALPILAALLLASFTGPTAQFVPGVVTTPLGQVIGMMLGVYALRASQFTGSFSRLRNVAVFFGVTIVTCAFAPTVTTVISAVTGNLSTFAYVSWSRTWAGYLLSCLIFTPLIISWSRADYQSMRGRYFEPLAAALLLIGSVYALFWRPFPPEFSFLIFAFFFIVHFWICLRFPTMIVTTSFFVTTALGIAGLFFHPAPGRPINQQLFSAELFFFLILPIFFAFYALVRERLYAVIELKQALRKLERESLIKTDFIAVLAHELRNPLAPVKTTLEILGLQNLDPETKGLITSAHRQVHTMRRLLDDLLDISRVNQGTIELRKERADLCLLINQAITSTKALFDRNHRFVLTPPCTTPLWLHVDPVRFEQAIVNLLNNAAKYTEEGGEITISYRITDGVLTLSVKDNGVGIPSEHLERIFEPFWQEQRRTSVAGGIGIGLALTKHIIELHGGHIEAVSEGRGKGSAFTMSIPVLDEHSTASAEKETAPSVVGSERILIVDDNRAAADSLQKLLHLKGHEAATAYTGEDALMQTRAFKPTLVLLDIGLPDMSGYAVAAQLRLNGYTGTVIALSGYGQEEDRQKAMKAGCDEHFTKPMSIARLEAYLAQ